MPALAARAAHPKALLYAHLYRPLTGRWFAALRDSPVTADLLRRARQRPLVDTLRDFNALFQSLVDECMAQAWADDAMDEVYAVHDGVVWMGDESPGADPTADAVRASLVTKLRRNVSLGVVEALLCLESGYRFAREVHGMTGEELAGTLLRSTPLYASLAVLHDEQERERISFLTGRLGYLQYPDVDYPHVLNGDIRIGPDKFVLTGPAGARRLRFVTPPVNRVVLNSPTMRCPAHQPDPGSAGSTYNDALWALLIEIYRSAGRFG